MVAATGIGSGLDIEGLVSQLIAAERAPAENRLLQQEASLTSELSAFGTFQGALGSLQSSLQTLGTSSTFNQRSVVSSNPNALLATVSGDAAVGSFNIEVDQLARSQSLASGSFESLTDEVGEGILTFRFGTVTATPEDAEPQTFDSFTVNADRSAANITIDSSNNTLEGVRDAINDADIGVAAAVVNDGTGFRLLLSSTQTGAANGIEIQVGDSGDGNSTDAAGLSRLAFNSSANNLLQTEAGRDAAFTVNGLDITSDRNSVEGVIDGVNFTLREPTEEPLSVTVSQNEQAVRSAVEGFIASFNGFVGVANNLTAFDPSTSTAGPLQGDFTARSIIGQLRSAISGSAVGFDGPFDTLSELGIRTQSDGTLSLNEEIFSEALSDNFEEIQGLFTDFGRVSSSGIEFIGSSDETEVGSYAINVTQLATQGTLAGAAIGTPGPIVIDNDNDSLSVSINGVSSGEILLAQGTYATGAELAAELQSKINGATSINDAGIEVLVSFTTDNRLEVRSSTYGSESAVSVDEIDTNTLADLGFSIAAGVDGVDVEGSIGGVPATGNGRVLTAAVGSAADGIILNVTGGALGPRGDVRFSTGIADSISGLVDGFLGSDGLIGLRTEGLQTGVDRIADDREDLATRLDALEARLRRQFNSLDTLLAGLQTTSDFLTTQLAAIPIPGANNDR
ncbi:MAG: flagellar filament capping protein FliD [Pseudomonadota bacterium]